MTGASTAIDVALVALYLVAILVLGWVRARRGAADEAGDYLLAGRTLTLPGFVATLVATWYGGVLGVGEYSYSYGLSNWIALGGPYYVAGVIFALLLAKRARASALTTVPERLLRDHGPAVATLGTLVVFLGAVPAPYVLMLGVLFGRIFGIGTAAGTIAAGVLSMLAVVGGGFRAIVRTNAVQFALMYGGFAIALVFALEAAGGVGALSSLPPAMLSWDGGLGLQAVLVWYVIALQTLVEPTFYQRCYAARSPRTARNGVLVSVLFWMVFDALTTMTGMLARVLVPDLDAPIDAYPALADQVLPPIVRGIFYVGLVATVMSTVESYLFVAATTLGYDVPLAWRAWRARRFAIDGEPAVISGRVLRGRTMWGLAVATVLATALALVSESAVTLWKTIGSVVTPALLLPLVFGFVPKVRAGARATFASIAVSASVAVGWMILGRAHGPAPFAGVEPIFPALAASVAIHAPAIVRACAQARGGPSPV